MLYKQRHIWFIYTFKGTVCFNFFFFLLPFTHSHVVLKMYDIYVISSVAHKMNIISAYFCTIKMDVDQEQSSSKKDKKKNNKGS